MQNLFLSQAYIDAHVSTIKQMFECELDNVQIEDCTYANDNRASIRISFGNYAFRLYLPTSLINVPDKEMYTDYHLVHDNDETQPIDEPFSSISLVFDCLVWDFYYA
jgi:hypothetical protein